MSGSGLFMEIMVPGVSYDVGRIFIKDLFLSRPGAWHSLFCHWLGFAVIEQAWMGRMVSADRIISECLVKQG